MTVPDPGKIRNWVAIIIAIAAAIIVVNSRVERIQANTEAIEIVDAKVDKVILSVQDIAAILQNQIAAAQRKTEIEDAEKRVIRGLCVEPEFQMKYDLKCELAKVGE